MNHQRRIRCIATIQDGSRCTQTASDTRDGLPVCGNHSRAYDEIAAAFTPRIASLRIQHGASAITAQVMQDFSLDMLTKALGGAA